MRTVLIGLVLAGIICGFNPARSYAYESALMSSAEKTKEVNTNHFRIIYQESLADSVSILAQACEEAYFVLTQIVDWTPEEKTTVLYLDSYDTHNGWATAVSHNTMAIYAAAPEQGSTLYLTGNYLRRTVFHEFMHILNLDQRSGYNKGISNIFGKIYSLGDPLSFLMYLSTASPNQLAPRWYLEGQAMWAESEFASPGRGQSTLVDMMLRCAVHDNTLLSPSKWYSQTPEWPYGTSAYIYGMRMMQYIYESSEKDNPVGQISQNVSKSLLFNFDRGVVKTMGKSWKTLAREMLDQERTKQHENIEILAKNSFTDTQRLTANDLSVSSVAYSGSKVYLLASGESIRSGIFVYDLASAKLSKIKQATGTSPFGALSASADGRYVYYTRLEVQESKNYWYEIRAYDTQSGSDTLVTSNGRYRYIDVSPDGQNLVAVSYRQAKAFLIETPLADAGNPDKEVILAQVPVGIDLAAPRYSPDGRHIVYVRADGDNFYINLFDRTTGSHRALWQSQSQLIAPAWHPGGDYIVFGSDINGVYNLYQIQALGDAQLTLLTNVWGGLFSPSFSADGTSLAAISFDGHGGHLTLIPYMPEAQVGVKLPTINPRWPSGKLTAVKKEVEQQNELFSFSAENQTNGQIIDQEHNNYNSFKSIRPDFWSPWFTTSAFGTQGGLAAVFSDPTQQQEVFFRAGVESEYDSPLANIAYTTRLGSLEAKFYGGVGQNAYSNLLVVDGTDYRFDYAEETIFGGLTLSKPLWKKMEHQVLANIGYAFTDREGIEQVEENYEGLTLETLPSEDSESSLWGQVIYYNGTTFNRSVSIEDGTLFAVGIARSLDLLGGQIDATRLRIDACQYISMPYANNHVFKMSGAYAAGWGDENAQGLFGLGGFSSTGLNLSSGVGRSLSLRGYSTNFMTGQSAARAGVSYRFPIWNLFKGAESVFPVYGRSLFAEVFYEGGRIWSDDNQDDDISWLNAAGVEVNFGVSMLRVLQFAPGIGVVYAPDRDEFDDTNEEVVVYLGFKLWYNF